MTIHSVVIQKLLSTNAHLGRRVAAHHFKIYSCGARNAMTIIDSDKTLICLRNACQFIGNLVRQKGTFLFVNTNSLCDEIVEEMTKRIGCKNDNSWRLGGFLTNSTSPRKFRGRGRKFNLVPIRTPDCVVIMDTERKSSVILEAAKLKVPIVGLVDSAMPWDTYKRITYPIPANDSVQFVYLFCNLITKTFLYEQKRLGTAQNVKAIEADPKTDNREEAQLQAKTSKANDEIFVIPYENLFPVPDDPLETRKLLDKIVVLKINCRLGTNMDSNMPKSTIELRDGLTCLDLLVNQIEILNSKYGCNIPLMLMNTINTHNDTLRVLEKHSNKNIHTFIQYQQVDMEDRVPVLSEGWASGDEMYPSYLTEAFLSLKKDGKLDVLLSQGKEYILVVSSDNLGDFVDPKIVNHLMNNKIDCCLEVMSASQENLKEVDYSLEGRNQSKKNLKFIETMWVDMKAVERFLEMVAFRKENYSISKFFDHIIGINVPQPHYVPVEATSELLLVQSDLYTVSDGTLTRNRARENSPNPSIELGPEFARINDFRIRIKSIPSIVGLDSLKVTGDVWFGSGITLKGKVSIMARPGMKIVIPDGATLENKVIDSPFQL